MNKKLVPQVPPAPLTPATPPPPAPTAEPALEAETSAGEKNRLPWWGWIALAFIGATVLQAFGSAPAFVGNYFGGLYESLGKFFLERGIVETANGMAVYAVNPGAAILVALIIAVAVGYFIGIKSK